MSHQSNPEAQAVAAELTRHCSVGFYRTLEIWRDHVRDSGGDPVEVERLTAALGWLLHKSDAEARVNLLSIVMLCGSSGFIRTCAEVGRRLATSWPTGSATIQ
jgi:hypothetical protein